MALTLRTDEQLEEALTALAEEEGASRQEIIRRAVLERYERAGHRNRVEGSARQMIERWGDVLERLGTE
jgi:predicted transcriptional regulator